MLARNSVRSCSLSFVILLLLIRTSPEEGVSRPAIKLSSVDFPQPDGPKIAIDSPDLTSSLKLLNMEV